MANVRVEQRNAHLAGAVQLSYVNCRDGQVAKGVVTVISNTKGPTWALVRDLRTAIMG